MLKFSRNNAGAPPKCKIFKMRAADPFRAGGEIRLYAARPASPAGADAEIFSVMAAEASIRQ